MTMSQDPFQKFLIIFSVMLVAVIEVLDMTIVNVALPQMMGQLGANSDQITWILTSYIVASAIMMPLTGLLVKGFGRKRLLYINILGFMISSMLCGLSTNLPEIVFFRIIQGLFGAALVPISQYIMRDSFEKHEQGKAMAIWGMGIIIAPIMGPTLGGYITDHSSWRWVFYINVPVCLIAMLMMRVLTETPRTHQRIDFLGLLLMSVGVGSLQLFLDRGNSSNWFDSKGMIVLCAIAILGLGMFILRGISEAHNIINLKLFRNRNFAVSTFIFMLYSVSMMGLIAMQPIFTQSLLGYTAENAGILMAPRGIAAMVSMMMAGAMINHLDSRYILLVGMILCVIGTAMMTRFNLDVSFSVMAIASTIQGFGMGLFFVPLSTLALSTLPEQDIPEASGLYSFGRNLGSSIGISLLSTVATRESQINWNVLGGHFTATNPALQRWVQVQHLTWHHPLTYHKMAILLSSQSQMIAFLDVFRLASIGFIAVIPLLFLLEKAKKREGSLEAH